MIVSWVLEIRLFMQITCNHLVSILHEHTDTLVKISIQMLLTDLENIMNSCMAECLTQTMLQIVFDGSWMDEQKSFFLVFYVNCISYVTQKGLIFKTRTLYRQSFLEAMISRVHIHFFLMRERNSFLLFPFPLCFSKRVYIHSSEKVISRKICTYKQMKFRDCTSKYVTRPLKSHQKNLPF